MVKCVFCGKEEREYIGVHLMKNDGSIAYYCSHKCRMNAIKLGRDKRKVRWTEAFHIARKEASEKKAYVAKKAEERVVEKAAQAEAKETKKANKIAKKK